MNPETHFTEVDDLSVRYIKVGNGKPLLFLHGWGCKAETMASVYLKQASSNTIYAPDLPGFGESSTPQSAWNIGGYAEFVIKLLDKLEIDQCDVLAHSFGGRVMLKLMSMPQTKKRFGKVLITGGAGMKPKRKPSFYLKKYTAKTLKAPFMMLPGKLKEKGLQKLRGTALWKSLGSSEYSQLNGVMREVFVLTVSEFLEPTLPAIDNDILLLWGENDDATPLYQAKRMESGLKNGVLVTLPNAGHYAFLDQPARFNAIAKAFFEG